MLSRSRAPLRCRGQASFYGGLDGSVGAVVPVDEKVRTLLHGVRCALSEVTVGRAILGSHPVLAVGPGLASASFLHQVFKCLYSLQLILVNALEHPAALNPRSFRTMAPRSATEGEISLPRRNMLDG